MTKRLSSSATIKHSATVLTYIRVLFQSLSMATAKVGWAISRDGHLLRTVDGGVSWTNVTPTVTPPPAAYTAPLLPFTLAGSTHTAWVLDARTETAYRTTDGGIRWQKGQAPHLDVVNDGSNQVDFVDARRGWLLVSSGGSSQDGELLSTTDGGMTWREVASSKTGNLPYGGAIAFSPGVPGLGWLRPDQGLGWTVPLYVTRDGGRTWRPSDLSTTYPHSWVDLPTFPAGGGGVLSVTTVRAGTLGGQTVYLTSTDGGAHWTPSSPLPVGMFSAPTFWLNSTTGWVYDVAQNTFYLTEDAGTDWRAIRPNMQFQKLPLDNFSFAPNGRVGWAVFAGGVLAFTYNGGSKWGEAH